MPPETTRNQISAILCVYDVSDIHWHWNPKGNDIYVQFGVEEIIDGIPVKVLVRVVCPIIWDKALERSPKPERRIDNPNLKISMRAMHWYIKTHLECSYAMQSSKVAGFLSDVVTPHGSRYFEELKPHLNKFKSLDNNINESPSRDVKTVKTHDSKIVIDAEIVNNKNEEHKDV